EFGLNEAITHFMTEIVDDAVIKISTSLDNTYKTKLPQNDLAVYRIVQELLSNILKYAHPKTLHIGSVCKNNSLVITMIHNGQGLTQPMFEELRYKGTGLGLKNIQNRIYLLQGEITFYEYYSGYRIELRIPIRI
ncbi:MAG: sensor histidine kinase, partial [Mucilaginibacter sp.]